ncbi:hypothetical protein MTR67_053641 [Solanum verrucosum]|uniref:Reverse transcriptase domain-containing protein n=1 Tax=Solanum verrucosum TaxID=315347 RepID=A0AAF1A253_SOLVR|nr:hypothetical protein MTR67_053641 [Solanum verrucosum]
MISRSLDQVLIEDEKEVLLQIQKWSAYFHAQCKIRASRNTITSIYTDSDIKLTDPVQVEHEFITLFKNLMGAETMPSPDSSLIQRGKCLTYQQKCKLITDVTDKELKDAVYAMPHDKAPGVDGFPVEFFTTNSTIVAERLILAVKEFFSSGKLLKSFSCTAVTLIPKVASPSKVKDYRLIACCKIVYKIITKILTHRIKDVISDGVSPSQTAFIEGRSILDNMLFSHDVLKCYTRKGLSSRCVMKVDLRKAYDSIEWCFLRSMLVELGFPYKFIQWVMECVTSVSYSLLMNGGLTEPFKGRRGIRQGDPMSPYLIFIAMDYLQRELNQVLIHPQFQFHPRCKKLGVVHICFADDLLMFCKADITSIKLLQAAFVKFSSVSVLQATIEKSSIYMSGVKPEFKLTILQTLGFCEGTLPFIYLGVSLSSKKLTTDQWLPLVEKITQKMKCWSAKLLSYAGRLQWIKSIVFGKKTNWAHVFLLPKKIMKHVESPCRSFLWTGKETISRRALVSWEKICIPKAAGGQNVISLPSNRYGYRSGPRGPPCDFGGKKGGALADYKPAFRGSGGRPGFGHGYGGFGCGAPDSSCFS